MKKLVNVVLALFIAILGYVLIQYFEKPIGAEKAVDYAKSYMFAISSEQDKELIVNDTYYEQGSFWDKLMDNDKYVIVINKVVFHVDAKTGEVENVIGLLE